MGWFKKSRPKEVRAALGILDEIECTFHPNIYFFEHAFAIVRKKIEEVILGDPEDFVQIIQGGRQPRQWIWSAIANVAGDHVESGEYHIYRGALNPLGPGKGLLALFDMAVDELVKLGCLTPEVGQQQKSAVRSNIADVG